MQHRTDLPLRRFEHLRAEGRRLAASIIGDNESNQQTPEDVLASTLASLPDEKLTGLALRLALTGHTDIPREGDFDFLAEAESAFFPQQPKKVAAKKTAKTNPIKVKPQTLFVKC